MCIKLTHLFLAIVLGFSSWAYAGIQGSVYVYNRTGRIIEVQVNGRYRGVIDPGASASYSVGDSAEKVTELYAEDASTGYYWSKSVSGAVGSYTWYVQD